MAGTASVARVTGIGPAQELLDHPALVDILSEILGGGPPAEDYYNFRCENSFVTLRKAGWKPGSTEVPHGGAGMIAGWYSRQTMFRRKISPLAANQA